MSRAIVNVAVNGDGTKGPYYTRAQERLGRSLDAVGFDENRCFWTNEYPAGSELHANVPYNFKQRAMAVAAEHGHRTLLWLDAVMVALRPPISVLRHIEEYGYVLWSHPPGEWTIGHRTSDACLKYYGMTRAEAFELEMLCSGVFGYSLDHPLGKKLHEGFVSAPPIAMRGAWHNRNNAVSKHSRVEGHRHDQSVLAILSHQLGLTLSPTPDPVAFFSHETEKTIFLHDPDMRLP